VEIAQSTLLLEVSPTDAESMRRNGEMRYSATTARRGSHPPGCDAASGARWPFTAPSLLQKLDFEGVGETVYFEDWPGTCFYALQLNL